MQQVARLERTTKRHGQTTQEVAYLVTSVPRSQADARTLLNWQRGHWGIENRSHYVRDVTLREDACRIRTGHGPHNIAVVRNATIALLRLAGHQNIAAALRACTWQPSRPLVILGILEK